MISLFKKAHDVIQAKDKASAKAFLERYYGIRRYKKLYVIDTLDEFACILNYYCSKPANEKYVYMQRSTISIKIFCT